MIPQFVRALAVLLSVSSVVVNAASDNSTVQHLVKRSMNGPYSGKDCQTVILVDSFYVNSMSAATPSDNYQLAQNQVMQVMQGVHNMYWNTFQLGFPLIEIRWLRGDNDGGVGMDNPAVNPSQLLQKLSNGVAQHSDNPQTAFKGLKNICRVHLITNQDLGGILGLSYTADDSSAAMCSTSGFNTGFTSINVSGRIGSLNEIIKTTQHEFGHSGGAIHDEKLVPTSYMPDISKCSGREEYVMAAAVDASVHLNTMSECSQKMFDHRLREHGECLVDHGSTSYLQFGNSRNPEAAPASEPPQVQNAVNLVNQSAIKNMNHVPVQPAQPSDQLAPPFEAVANSKPTATQADKPTKARNVKTVVVTVFK